MKILFSLLFLLICYTAYGRFSFRAESISEAEYLAKQAEAGRSYEIIPDTLPMGEISSLLNRRTMSIFNDKLKKGLLEKIDYEVFQEDSTYNFYGGVAPILIYKFEGFQVVSTRVCELHTCHSWFFNPTKDYEYIGDCGEPLVVNKNGLAVSQKGFDCCGSLDLSFYVIKEGAIVYLGKFISTHFSEAYTAFCDRDDTFYLKCFTTRFDSGQYLKIEINNGTD